MAVSLTDLQAQYDALKKQCPRLLPAVVPHGYDVEDLWGLVQTEGKASKQELRSFLSEAAKQYDASGQGCCVCGADGQACASHEATADESQTLRFTVFPETSFSNRTVTLASGGFACGSCRAMRDAQRFVHFAALRTSAAHPEREALARALVVHLASLNSPDALVGTRDDALDVWTQEVTCRAYALAVVASGINGWRVLGPAGSGPSGSEEGMLVRQRTPGLALKIARALLSPKTKAKGSGSKANGEAAARAQQDRAEGDKAKQAGGKAGGSAQVATEKAAKVSTGKRKQEAPEAAAVAGATPGKKLKQQAAAQAAPSKATPSAGHKTQVQGKIAGAGKTPTATTPKAARTAKAVQTPATAGTGTKNKAKLAAPVSGKKKA